MEIINLYVIDQFGKFWFFRKIFVFWEFFLYDTNIFWQILFSYLKIQSIRRFCAKSVRCTMKNNKVVVMERELLKVLKSNRWTDHYIFTNNFRIFWDNSINLIPLERYWLLLEESIRKTMKKGQWWRFKYANAERWNISENSRIS